MRMMVLALAFWLCAGFPAGAEAKPKPEQVQVGEVTVTLAGPEGLVRVDGRDALAKAYMERVASKLKLQALALYADPGEWDRFVAAAADHRPTSVPVFALLCTTTSMPGKKYDQKGVRREFGKYERWFSLAADNRPLAALLTAKGNDKLTEILGVDIGFQFKVDQFTKKFDQSSDSVAFGAKLGFNVFGRPSDVFLTATALAVGDKLVFLGYFENSGAAAEIAAIQNQAKSWRKVLSGLNADQYTRAGTGHK